MFADRVTERELIVVGAVYDFRNDMKQGYGSLNIVNVNGHTEPAKIAAFVKAIDDLPGTLPESAIANMSSLGSSFRSGPPSAPSERSPLGAHAERAPAANNEHHSGPSAHWADSRSTVARCSRRRAPTRNDSRSAVQLGARAQRSMVLSSVSNQTGLQRMAAASIANC